MWTKLSADKKSELMKAYKKGGFSYRDMIDDYNTSYEKFEVGGETDDLSQKPAVKPAVVTPVKENKWGNMPYENTSYLLPESKPVAVAKPTPAPAVIKRGNVKYQTSGGGKNYYNVNGSWVSQEDYNNSKSIEVDRKTGLPINKYGGIQEFKNGGKVNTLEGDLISKVIMNRNRDKDFVQRAYAVGEYPNSNMFVQPDANQFGDKNSHLMGWGDDDNGQAWMFPTIFNDKNEAIKVPNQYADYISSVGYKNATGIPTYMYGGIQRFEEGGIEESINKSLGNPMLKAEIDSDYKRPTVDPRTRRQKTSEPVDNVRHAAAGRYTQEAIENYANLIPYASAIPGFSKAAGFIGSNILGLGHEASTLFNNDDDDTRTMGMKVKESAADAYNNMIGSVIGASNLTPYQKKAYMRYLSETGKMPTGQYNKKKDPTYKKEMGGIQKFQPGGSTEYTTEEEYKSHLLDPWSKEKAKAQSDWNKKKFNAERLNAVNNYKATNLNFDSSLMDQPNFASETVQSQAPASKYKSAEQNKAAVKTAIEGRAETAYNKHLQREEIKKKYPTKNQEEIQRIQDKIESPLFYEPAGQLASYATRFHGLTDDEIASITGSGTMGDRLGVAANMAAWGLANEVGGKLIGKGIEYASPYIKQGLNAAGKAVNSSKESGVLSNAYKGVAKKLPESSVNIESLNQPSRFLDRINMERQGIKTKSNIIKENIQDGNFKISSKSTPSKGLVNVNIESPTGSIQATRNPDGSYGLSFKDNNPFNAGKSMLKLKDQLAGKTIHETKSFSTDSYANILNLKKKLPFEDAGFVPLNSSNKANNFLDDLFIKNTNEWSASAKFKSEEAAIEGSKRMDDYMLKLGQKTKSKVVNNNGKFEVHVPNYKIKVPKVN